MKLIIQYVLAPHTGEELSRDDSQYDLHDRRDSDGD